MTELQDDLYTFISAVVIDYIKAIWCITAIDSRGNHIRFVSREADIETARSISQFLSHTRSMITQMSKTELIGMGFGVSDGDE